jgi:hypothetical protein
MRKGRRKVAQSGGKWDLHIDGLNFWYMKERERNQNRAGQMEDTGSNRKKNAQNKSVEKDRGHQQTGKGTDVTPR